MFKFHDQFILTILLVSILGTAGCYSTPISNRKQLLLIPEQQEITLGMQSYEDILAEEKLSSNPHYVEMVQRVGQRIAAEAGHDEYAWEFRVIESPEMNAFALPGGKVAIYEGILPICENEAGLAVVMSHEIAHAIARHGGERMTQQGVATAAGKVVDFYSKDKEQKERERVRAVFGAAAQYGYILPYSRKHESEADQIGLILMSRAGYDPKEAPRFWKRFSQQGGQKPPEFMSTHPSDERRAADLEAMLPEALAEYSTATEQYALGKPIFNASNLAGSKPKAPSNTIVPASSLSGPPTDDPFFTRP
ncbi:MAG TPA: hypothetical protein DD473_08880 [Planctomycetaceae bacterium]|nr:hypothetical protein [Planctomycetaceae bacterium]